MIIGEQLHLWVDLPSSVVSFRNTSQVCSLMVSICYYWIVVLLFAFCRWKETRVIHWRTWRFRCSYITWILPFEENMLNASCSFSQVDLNISKLIGTLFFSPSHRPNHLCFYIFVFWIDFNTILRSVFFLGGFLIIDLLG